MTTDRYLATYLRDHLALGRAGIDLVRRIIDENEDNTVGVELDEFATELDEELVFVGRAMEILDVEPSRLKIAGARLAQKLGRLKRNGNAVKYSPLSRVVEIEALSSAVQARRGLWQTLRQARRVYPGLRELPVDRFVARTAEQLERLEELHDKAVRMMFETGADRRRPRR